MPPRTWPPIAIITLAAPWSVPRLPFSLIRRPNSENCRTSVSFSSPWFLDPDRTPAARRSASSSALPYGRPAPRACRSRPSAPRRCACRFASRARRRPRAAPAKPVGGIGHAWHVAPTVATRSSVANADCALALTNARCGRSIGRCDDMRIAASARSRFHRRRWDSGTRTPPDC